MADWLEAEQRVERARELSESQRWAEALGEIDIALSINSENAGWQAHRGFLLEQLEQLSEAVKAYETAARLDPDDPEVSLALALTLVRLGRFARALEVLEELAGRYPDFEPAYCHRIGVYADLGQHDRAEEMFYLAQQLNGQCPHCFFHIGGSLADRGKTAKAIYCWQRVLALEPEYVGVKCRIARALRAQNRLGESREYYLQELRDDPGNTDLLYEMAEADEEAGDLPTATARLRQIIELDPDHDEAHYALGKLALRSGRPKQALKCFDKVKELAGKDPNMPGFFRYLGEALFRLGRFKEASAQLELATQEHADDPDVWVRLGDCYLAADRAERAASQYRRALALDARHPMAHHSLGLSLMRTGNPGAGLQHCLDALRSKPDHLPAMYSAAAANIQLSRWREARAMLRCAACHGAEEAAIRRLRSAMRRYRARRFLKALLAPFRFVLGRSGE